MSSVRSIDYSDQTGLVPRLIGVINPYVTNGLSHPYHLDESTFILGASEVFFISFFDDDYVLSKQNSKRLGYSEQNSHPPPPPIGLFCLPMFIKRAPGLYGLMVACLHRFVVARYISVRLNPTMIYIATSTEEICCLQMRKTRVSTE